MKKSKIWISVCIYLLLCATSGMCSSATELIFILKQNIPKDYKIGIRQITKEVGATCWVDLNVFHLEKSLEELTEKFGKFSSNRKNITLFIQILQDLRLVIERDQNLGQLMSDFECHYRDEQWSSEYYFDYLEGFLNASSSVSEKSECESPLCPTTAQPITTDLHIFSTKVTGCDLLKSPCNGENQQQTLPKLLSLLIIPLAAFVVLLVWKVNCSRSRNPPDRNLKTGDSLSQMDKKPPPLGNEISEEKIRLKTEAV